MTESRSQKTASEQKDMQGEHKVVVCTIGKESFALPLGALAEIYKAHEITRLPLSPDFLAGVISVHGNLASVFSLARILDLGTQPDEGLLLILGQEYGGFALLVERTTGFSSYATLEDVSLEAAGGRDTVNFIEGVFRNNGELITLINPEKLRIWIDNEFTKGEY
jgi:chemotaxis signal transduction protein